MTELGKRQPLILGAAQITSRPEKPGVFQDHEPVVLMAAAITGALAQAGLDPRAPIDLLATVPPLAWGYHDLPGELCRRSGVQVQATLAMDHGGSAPVEALLRVSERIARGEIQSAIVVGGESMYSRRRAKREGVTLPWTPFEGSRDLVGNQRPLTNPLEERHGLFTPRQLFPLLENAFRSHKHWSLSEHRTHMARLLAANSKLAPSNRYAWFPRSRSVQELEEVSVENRMICFPYTRLMNAVMEVDMAGALVVANVDFADRFGIPDVARSAIRGGALATDAWTPTERPVLHDSPALQSVARHTLQIAGRDADAVDLWDLYSCFPIAIQFGCQAFGLAGGGSVPLTVTGGLAYAGGPGSSYPIHSLATMHEKVVSTSKVGVVTGLGNIATKHASVILLGNQVANMEPGFNLEEPNLPKEQKEGPPLVDLPSGPAVIETYTVEFDRDGSPVSAPVVIRLPGGERSLALVRTPKEMQALVADEGVGRQVKVESGTLDEPNIAHLVEHNV